MKRKKLLKIAKILNSKSSENFFKFYKIFSNILIYLIKYNTIYVEEAPGQILVFGPSLS